MSTFYTSVRNATLVTCRITCVIVIAIPRYRFLSSPQLTTFASSQYLAVALLMFACTHSSGVGISKRPVSGVSFV